MSAEIELPPTLVAWVESAAGAPVVGATPHLAGASREAWSVDVATGAREAARALFLLRDKGDGGGSARDAAVLRALGPTDVPVPPLVAHSEAQGAILMERLPGRSDFPAVDDEAEREPTARHLMTLTARLHALDVEALAIEHLEVPASAEEGARRTLEATRAACRALGPRADPFFSFALDWLEANVPKERTRLALVHSDMGPGNFLYEKGAVTGIVDWEVAHVGDPMEDLAAIAVRDMATPVGALPKRLAEYEAASGIRVDRARVDYYRALVLTRNSAMIGLGLANPSEGFDVVEMTMYQTLLLRGAALVLCDNLGCARPTAEASVPEADDTARAESQPGVARWLDTLRRDVEGTIAPAVRGAVAARRAESVARGLAALAHAERRGPALLVRERADLAALFGTPVAESNDPDDDLRRALDARGEGPPDETAVARYLARRFHRLAERHRPLMGALHERLPQPLEVS